ncbi:MAG: hypothetical protein LBQ77_03240 [Treponema sp.]|jgi:hypothetical protein|nr:hypothetical protein [Treponema sp.]
MKESIDESLEKFEEDYRHCYRVIRNIFEYLEKIGLQEFNQYSKYKWSFDHEKRQSYVCIRYGNSLVKKSLLKRRANIEESDLYKWVDNKDLILEAIDEAYHYIHDRIAQIKTKMEEMRTNINEYEEKLADLDDEYEIVKSHKEIRDVVPPGRS